MKKYDFSDCRSRRRLYEGSKLISGFINLGHSRDSHQDIRIPIYLHKQKILYPEERIFEQNLVKRRKEIICNCIVATEQTAFMNPV